ncbi:MAG: choice-of-anchor D domain-containing protein, partial [Cyclobacteriaceae bacterium]
QMFLNASSFDQDLGGWDFSNLSGNDLRNFLNNSGLSVDNYDKLLIGLEAQIGGLNPSISNFGAQNVYYCAGESAHSALIAFGWTFDDGGSKCITLFDGPDTTAPEIFNAQAQAIDYGSTSTTKSRDFTILNNQSIAITNVQVTSPGPGFATSLVFASIPAGGTETFSVALDGSGVATYAETVTISSPDITGPFLFDVTGEATAGPEPEIKVFEGPTITGNEILDGVSFFDFGFEYRGTDILQEITITNLGSTDLNISNISFSGTAFSVLSLTALTIPVDGSEVVQLQLSGLVGGTFSEILTIENDDTSEAVFDFFVSGFIEGPDILVVEGIDHNDPEIPNGQVTPIDFGSSPFGSDIVKQFAITDETYPDLFISNISISGTAFSFTIPTSFAITGQVDGIYDEHLFEITLSGATPGTFTETVTITSDDDTDPIFTFPITGTITGPTISSFNPTSGTTGTSITITGTNFTGTTAVSFGGTPAGSFTVDSPTSITAVVASGSSGDVSVTTPGGTALLSGFVFLGQEINVYAGADNTATVIVDGQVAAIDFGSAVQGNNVVQTFAIENTGSSSL